MSVVPGSTFPVLSTVEVDIGDESVNWCDKYPQLETDDIDYEACKYYLLSDITNRYDLYRWSYAEITFVSS